MYRSTIINYLIEKFNYKSYLEIGILEPRDNFDLVDVEYKHGVEPNPWPNVNKDLVSIMTSDEFFASNTKKFDIVFIDGMHEKNQVLKDIKNSLECLNENGTIVVHDCNPYCEIVQRVPQETQEWNGDVWKAIAHLRTTRDDLTLMTVDSDQGVGIIQRGKQDTIDLHTDEKDWTYETFEKYRKELLNLISIQEFKKWIG